VACSVICISHADGAGGRQVGKLVAERLGLRYVDEEIVARAAAKGGLSPADVADEEQRKSALVRLLRELGRGAATESYSFAGPAGPTSTAPAPDAVRGLIQDAIAEVAADGDAVIVAHAAARALPDKTGVLRVLVTASPESRAQRVADADELEPKDARRAIADSDAARADYLKRFYGVGNEQSTDYDLVVNTDALSFEQAVELVALAAR
jgi:cytidylate kinase